MAAPRITLRCDCGKSEAQVAYGERWTCEACGRTYDTSGIPSGDYAAIQSLRRRYRIIGYSGVALVAAFVLLLALTAQEFQLFIGLPFILLVWFMYVRPVMRSRYYRRVQELQRTWTLKAEGEL
jgi:Flp pilus assembly protein TadB